MYFLVSLGVLFIITFGTFSAAYLLCLLFRVDPKSMFLKFGGF